MRSTAICAAVLIGLSACGDGEESPRQDATQPSAAAPGAETSGSAAADSGARLPPGLAPVAVDDEGQSTADRATGGGTTGPRPSGDAPGSDGAARPQGAPAGPDAPVSNVPAADAESPATQEDEGAKVLRRAAEAYADVRSMQAAFVMEFNNPILRQKMTSRGTLYQQRPDRIALRFTEPAGDVILSDGDHFYIYQPSIDASQATQTPASPGGGGGVDLQAQFIGDPVQRFRYTVEGREEVGGRPAVVMTLVPRERAEYRSLKVWFDTRDSLARRFEITEHNGSVRRFDLSGLQVNPSIPADVFRFTPPTDVRIVRVG